MPRKPCSPLPEAIDGKPWTIRQSAVSASVDLRARVMLVPTDDDAHSLFLRAHEQAHCAITPRQSPDAVASRAGVSMEALQVCEDARVHWFLEESRVDVSAGGLTDDEIRRVAVRGAADPRALAAAIVSTWRTGDGARLLPAVRSIVDEPGNMGAELFARVVEAALQVAREVRRPGRGRFHPAKSTRGFRRNTIPAARLFDQWFAEDGPIVDGGKRKGTGKDYLPDDETLRKLMESHKHRTERWGEMRPPVRLKMERSRNADRRGRESTYRDEGAAPSAMHRWATDQRIFRRRKPAIGGTVLIDVSGSMSLSAEQVRSIVNDAPAATVAMYSGRATSGDLIIIADRGMVASDAEIERARSDMGSGNIIDGPALRWLNAQEEPRVWVCDGVVTGRHDACGGNLFSEAAALTRRGGIRRVPRADGAGKMLADLRKHRR